MRLDLSLMSDDCEFQMCEAAVKNARRVNSVLALGTESSRASDDRRVTCII